MLVWVPSWRMASDLKETARVKMRPSSSGSTTFIARSRALSPCTFSCQASRLDPATEKLIERAVDRLLRDRTGVIIAHRLATITRADDILILEDGEVIEYGERQRLADDSNSRLSHLLITGMEEVLA